MAAFNYQAPKGQQAAFGQPQWSPPQQPVTKSSAPDMSVYNQRVGSVQIPQGAQVNDMSKPQGYNMWGAQAAYGASQQMGTPWQQPVSYTLPGSAQSFNMLTGQPLAPAMPSFDGNLAYQPPANRPGPVSWDTQGLDGQQYAGQQGWQQAAMQRDAFSQGLIGRLGEYAGGQATGAPAFDFNSILGQANQSLQNTNWQNPFMDPMAYNALPSMNQPAYDPTPAAWQAQKQQPLLPPSQPQEPVREQPRPQWMRERMARPAENPLDTVTNSPSQRMYQDDFMAAVSRAPTQERRNWMMDQVRERPYLTPDDIEMANYWANPNGYQPSRPEITRGGYAQPILPSAPGDPYNPQASAESLPEVPGEPARRASVPYPWRARNNRPVESQRPAPEESEDTPKRPNRYPWRVRG